MSKKSGRRDEGEEGGITEEEKRRYDRQIRVWGSEAQHRIQTSKVLVCGLSGLNIEVVKNIVLAGMNVVLLDSTKVQITDLSCNFFLGAEDVGRPTTEACLSKIQQLNSFAKVEVESQRIEALVKENPSFFEQFNVVSMAGVSETQCLNVSKICRSNKSTCFASWAFGHEGTFVSDFGENFEYKKDAVPDKVQDIKTVTFPSLQNVLGMTWSGIQNGKFLPVPRTFVKACLLSKLLNSSNSSSSSSSSGEVIIRALEANGLSAGFLPQEDVRELSAHVHTPLGPDGPPVSISVVSVLGSFLAQEVIKSVSRTGQPGFNAFLFDGSTCDTKVYPICEAMKSPYTIEEEDAAVLKRAEGK